MKKLLSLWMLALCVSFFTALNAQDLLTHDFNDGGFGGFERTYSSMADRVSIINGRVQCHWDEGIYNGSNTTKKSEFRAQDNGYTFTQEFWTGFWLKIHGNTLENNPNTHFSIMQIWGFRGDGAANHYAMVRYTGAGELIWQHRYNMTTSFTNYTIMEDFPKDEFVRVVIRVKLNNVEDGTVQVWIDDELKVNKTGQRIGFGDQNENGQHSGSYSTPGSWGIYAYSNEEYVDGETRTVTYDDVSLWNGTNGYDIVDPNGGLGSVPVVCDNFDAFSEINASDYCEESGTKLANGNVGYIENNDWISFEGIDFGSGSDAISASVSSGSSGGSIEVRQGSTTGTLLGTLNVSNTGSWTNWETVTADISTVSGVQDIYLVFKGGSGYLLDISSLKFTEVETVSASCGDFDAYSSISASDYCEESGTKLANGNVGYIENNDWISFEGVNFENGASSISASVSSGSSGGSIEIRQGSTTGPLLGRLDVSSTGSWTNWETISATINTVSGTQDVYFVFTGGTGYLLDIAWFKFEASNDDNSNTGVNLALSGTASQSSNYSNTLGLANLAIDGNTSGVWSQRSVTHTKTESNAWWQVDLGANKSIGSIVLYNRTDCCSSRLSNFTVSVLNSSGVTVYSESFTNTPDSSLTINTGDVIGKIVKVQLNGANPLSLAEVEVYAGSITNSPNCDLPYAGSNISVNDGLVDDTSDAIDISCVSSVNISMDVTSAGNMETVDYLNIYYQVDNGSWQVITENVDSFNAKTVSISGISGDILRLRYQIYNTWSDEIYTVSNIKVTSSANKDITTLSTTEVLIYPNPIVTTTTIANAADSVITIYNMNGSVVFTKDISSESEIIDLSQLSVGVYYAQITGKITKSVLKLIKQ